jgi:hypothetical protein
MKFTLAEIRGMQRGLLALVNTQLPIKISYKISKLFNFCSEELIAIEKARVELVKQYSKKDEKTGEYKVEPENEKKFREEFDQFLKEEVECDFTPIPLQLIEDIKITAFDLSGLSKIINNTEEEKSRN